MKNRNLIVGLFVLAGLTLFTVGLFMIGNRHEAFSRHIEYYAEFTDLSGLTKGSKVQVAGMDAGQIIDIAIPPTPSLSFGYTSASMTPCMVSSARIPSRRLERKASWGIRFS